MCLQLETWIGPALIFADFSIRARALGSLLAPIITIIVVQIIGVTLDNHRIQTRIRLLATWSFLMLLMLMSVVWLLVMNVRPSIPSCRAGISADGISTVWTPSLLLCTTGPHPALGSVLRPQSLAVPSPGYSTATVRLALSSSVLPRPAYTIPDYYMASFVFPREADGVRLTRIIATLRSAESGSAAIAFGINSIGLSLVQVCAATPRATDLSLTYIQIGWINFAFVVLVLFLGAYVLQYIWVEDRRGTFDTPHGHPTVSEALAQEPAKQ